ncbi:hypothetical protein GUJ93_ZPchr0007g4544 [Zizania palustris]|uniref:Uncharacterized protein n=1 Tax=Zizania palustris TaxID=103762 RepID=A0A8J5T4D2_ZIZPA|nr:hypothetical protein GUJ93_ZPchr0007g4544 [Zizania palustris]
MPKHIDGEQFISSMSNSSLSLEDGDLKENLVLDENITENKSGNDDGVPDKSNEDVSSLRGGGIFKFLGGPKPGDIECNLHYAIHCYDAAKETMLASPMLSTEMSVILKKRSWAFNELGRHRLENRNLGSAEIDFADAIRAFQDV